MYYFTLFLFTYNNSHLTAVGNIAQQHNIRIIWIFRRVPESPLTAGAAPCSLRRELYIQWWGKLRIRKQTEGEAPFLFHTMKFARCVQSGKKFT